jgi:hypothetical protein
MLPLAVTLWEMLILSAKAFVLLKIVQNLLGAYSLGQCRRHASTTKS